MAVVVAGSAPRLFAPGAREPALGRFDQDPIREVFFPRSSAVKAEKSSAASSAPLRVGKLISARSACPISWVVTNSTLPSDEFDQGLPLVLRNLLEVRVACKRRACSSILAWKDCRASSDGEPGTAVSRAKRLPAQGPRSHEHQHGTATAEFPLPGRMCDGVDDRIITAICLVGDAVAFAVLSA